MTRIRSGLKQSRNTSLISCWKRTLKGICPKASSSLELGQQLWMSLTSVRIKITARHNLHKNINEWNRDIARTGMGWDPISNTMMASEEAWAAAFAVSPLTYIKPITYYCKSQESAPYILYTLAKWMTQVQKESIVHNKKIWLQSRNEHIILIDGLHNCHS